MIFIGCSSQNEKIKYEAIRSDNKLSAQIIVREGSFLFSDKYYLRIKNKINSLSYTLEKELMEGTGDYEGGIADIKWLSDGRVFIERAVNDRGANLIFSLKDVTFQDIQDSIPKNHFAP